MPRLLSAAYFAKLVLFYGPSRLHLETSTNLTDLNNTYWLVLVIWDLLTTIGKSFWALEGFVIMVSVGKILM